MPLPRSRLFLCLLLCLLLSFPFAFHSAAQQVSPQAARRDTQALALLARCSAAMGSPSPASTFHASGRLLSAHPDDPPAQLVLQSRGDAQTRWELTSAGHQDTIVLHKGSGKFVRDFQQTPMPPWQVLYVRPEHFPALLCATELARPNMDVVYVGLERMGDTAAHHIQISTSAKGKSKSADAAARILSEFHIFLDPQSFVVLKTKRFAFSPEAIENRSDFETYYNKYALVSGVLTPFVITNFLAGQKLEDIVFDNIQLNLPLGDAEFTN